MAKKQSKGLATGLHKQYFNGSPEHVGKKPAPAPIKTPAPKGY